MTGVPSPCVKSCEMDALTGWCRGCARRLDEIAAWGSASESRRRDILDRLPGRRIELQRLGLWLGNPRPPSSPARSPA